MRPDRGGGLVARAHGAENGARRRRRDLIASELIPRLADEPLSQVVGRLLGDIVGEGAHRGLVDLVFGESHRWLVANPEKFADALRTRAPWWTPEWVDDRVTSRVHAELVKWVADVRDDPHHEAREALDALLRQLADDLQNDPDHHREGRAAEGRACWHSRRFVGTAMSLWKALRRVLQESLASPDSAVRTRADRGDRRLRRSAAQRR